MKPTPDGGQSKPGRKRRFFWRLLALLLVAFLAYCGLLYQRIAQQSRVDEARPADVIVVLGAAEDGGKPFPVYRVRLGDADEPFEKGLAPFGVTSGGTDGRLGLAAVREGEGAR